MWPFTSRRIFANRWWALGFAAYVCWQAVSLIGPEGDAAHAGTDTNSAVANEQEVEGALNAL